MNILKSTFTLEKSVPPSIARTLRDEVGRLPGVLQCTLKRDHKSYAVTFDSELCKEEEINRVLLAFEDEKNEGMEFNFLSFLVIFVLFLVLTLINMKILRVSGIKTHLYILAAIIGVFAPFYQIRFDEEFREISNYSQKLFNTVRTSRSILFILGRLFGYTLIGLAFGYLGSLLKHIPIAFPLFQLIASAYVISLGLYILGVKGFRKVHRSLPYFRKGKIISSNMLKTGLLSCLIPTITVQVMQIFAVAYGNPLFGALLLFIYTLSTIPFMVSNDVIAKTVGKSRISKASATSGIFVIFMGMILLLTGLMTNDTLEKKFPTLGGPFSLVRDNEAPLRAEIAKMDGKTQSIEVFVGSDNFSPGIIYVRKNVPLTINFSGQRSNEASAQLYFSPLDIRYATGEETGTLSLPVSERDIVFYNWMGTQTGKIIVTDDPEMAFQNSRADLTDFEEEKGRFNDTSLKDKPLENVFRKAELSKDLLTQKILIEGSANELVPFIIVAEPLIPLEMVLNLKDYDFMTSVMTIQKSGDEAILTALKKRDNYTKDIVTFPTEGTYFLLDHSNILAVFHIEKGIKSLDLGAVRDKFLNPHE